MMYHHKTLSVAKVMQQFGAPGLQFVRTLDVGPHIEGGVSYGGAVALMRFPKVPHARPARGWRRHLRRVKAAQRRARK